MRRRLKLLVRAPRRCYASASAHASAIVSGDRRALSKGITLVESLRRADHQRASDLISRTHELAPRKDTFRVGFCGPPGVGKSSLIEELGRTLVEEEGRRVAVLTVDPSSHFSGGSILGDKTRMPALSKLDGAYVRSSATWGTLGGVAHATGEAIELCEGAGHDTVLVETVGVGQSEVLVAEQVDMVVLLVGPAGGDELQGIKKGIVEIADLVLVSKADGDYAAGARAAKGEYMRALQLVRRKNRLWRPRCAMVSAHTDPASVRAAWDTMQRFRDEMRASGYTAAERERQRRCALWPAVEDDVMARLRAEPAVRDLVGPLGDRLASSGVTPRAAAAAVVDAFVKSLH